ncbi:UDP-glucose 4-epimerase family protein [Paraburkholderia hayleyella]|uniref:UDP-glucose 4-epimerase family protein n=1 Tax=Paraburkholderia hayleyella TaxID=2152889 RepID=UPI001291D359|nr:SDR family oxidoreductase [Paraburkholderia hayleyella]
MRIAVTGANGFIGRALGQVLCEAGHEVTGLVRRQGGCAGPVRECLIADDDFVSLAEGMPFFGPCEVVVHLAARVHVMRDAALDPLAAYRAANVAGALNVARAARRSGAQRLIFVSSVKALGDVEPGHPWREDDRPAPADPYGISKHEAEQALLAFGEAQGLEVVIVRPPLVYGPGVRANFRGLMAAVAHGIPLPLGAVSAQRSMVYAGNLADAMGFLAQRSTSVAGIWHVSDGDDLTVTELVRALGVALGRPARLLPVPPGWLRGIGRLSGKTAQIERLTNALRIDSSRLRETLGWTPPWSVTQGLAATARDFREAR